MRFFKNAVAMRLGWVVLFAVCWHCRELLCELASGSLGSPWPVRVGVYCSIYVTMTGLAVPGAVILTALAGPLFGVGAGTLVASFSSTLGATFAFLLSRRLMFPVRQPIATVPGSRRESYVQLGVWELLLLRLTPVMPFFAVNLLAGKSRLTVRQYWLASQIGMLPATFLMVRAGATISSGAGTTTSEVLSCIWPLAVLSLTPWLLRWVRTCRSQDSYSTIPSKRLMLRP